MHYKQAFPVLGIEVTRDKKEIKRAYAVLVKKFHPEEYPDEWACIHEAYEIAMQYAKSQGITEQTVEEKTEQIQLSQEDERIKWEQFNRQEKQHIRQERELNRQRQEKLQRQKEEIRKEALLRKQKEDEEQKRKAEEERLKEEVYQKQQKEYDTLFANRKEEIQKWNDEKFGDLCYRMKQLLEQHQMTYAKWDALFRQPEQQEFRKDPRTIQKLAELLEGRFWKSKEKEQLIATIKEIEMESYNEEFRLYCGTAILNITRTKVSRQSHKEWLAVVILIILIIILLYAKQIANQLSDIPKDNSEISTTEETDSDEKKTIMEEITPDEMIKQVEEQIEQMDKEMIEIWEKEE